MPPNLADTLISLADQLRNATMPDAMVMDTPKKIKSVENNLRGIALLLKLEETRKGD